MESLILLGLIIFLALPLFLVFMLLLTRGEIKRITGRLEAMTGSLSALEARIRELDRLAHEVKPGPAPEPEPAKRESPRPPPSVPESKPAPAAPVPVRPLPPPVRIPGPERQPQLTAPPAKAPETPPMPPKPPEPPRPAAAPAPPLPPKPVAPSRPRFDWENLVGVQLFSWIAGIALTLAAVFFLRYSIEMGWLSPPVRMAMGSLAGIGLLVLCELKAARRYRVTANALDAAGVAILFSTFFAAHALWKLIPALPAFLLLVLVTCVAVLLSIRRDSLFIALLGLLGGFATPALLSTGEDRPIPLFGYLLLLNAGLAWVAYRKKWHVLTALCLVLTTLYQWVWVARFLRPDSLPVAAGVFLVFPILSFAAFALSRGGAPGEGGWSRAGQMVNISAALPLLFALYLAVVPGYGYRYGILFGFLLCLDAGLLAIAIARSHGMLHAAGGLTTLLVTAIWLKTSYYEAAWPGILAFTAAFVLLYLAAPLIARYFKRDLRDAGERASYAAPLMLFVFPVLAQLESRCAAPGLLFSALFLLVALIAAQGMLTGSGSLYIVAAFFALTTQAIWSARYLAPETLLPALGVYGAFGLLFLAVPMIARRLHRPLQQGTGGLVILGSLFVLTFLAGPSVAPAAVWGLGILLAFLSLGLVIEGRHSGAHALPIAGLALSWLILGAWWSVIPVSSMLLPALVVTGGYALLALAGSLWLLDKSGHAGAAASNGPFLALAGHLFLLYAASQRPLSIPPWPIFAVLLVLDLAIGAAALWLKSGRIHLGAIAASGVIVDVWALEAAESPWPHLALAFSLAVVGISFVWIGLARRVRIAEEGTFRAAAAAALLLAQFAAMIASMQPGSPAVPTLLGFHLVLLLALFWLAGHARWHLLPLVAVAHTGIAGILLQVRSAGSSSWREELLFSASIYAVFLVRPLVLGRRIGRSSFPYVDAVAASAVFFFLARQSMIEGGLGAVIGILPVGLAVLTCGLLLQLLRLETAGARALGRLALVAGAALAFITVAIPLQLDREWITIGWALEGAALAWLYGRIPHRGLFWFSTALLVTAFARLALNPSVFEYQVRGLRIWNWYLYTYLTCAAALFAAARFFSRTQDFLMAGWPRLSRLLPAGGAILLFLLVNIEIADYFSEGPAITFNFSAGTAQDLTYTLGWAAFALCLLGAGLAMRSRPARIASIGLLLVTVLKCFLRDLGRLGGLYRVASFVGLAVCLLLVALLIQKFVLAGSKEAK